MYNSGNNMLGYKRNNSKNLYVWAIESVMQGKWVTFRNIHRKNYCLDDNEKKISVSTNTVLYTLACDYKNENQWFSIEAYKKVDMPKGWFNVVGKTGLCVASRLNNGNLQQEKCKGQDDLLWKAENHKNGLIIKNKTGRAMEAQRKNKGNNMLGYKRNNSKNLYVWAIESVMQGKWVTFRNIHRKNYCLDDNEKKISVSTNTVLYPLACDYKNENQWFS